MYGINITVYQRILFILIPLLISGRASGFDSVLPSGPDIAQFKQGVKTVAGKMAVLANGVMNTIQVRYQQGQSVLPILADAASYFPVSTDQGLSTAKNIQHLKVIRFTKINQIT